MDENKQTSKEDTGLPRSLFSHFIGKRIALKDGACLFSFPMHDTPAPSFFLFL